MSFWSRACCELQPLQPICAVGHSYDIGERLTKEAKSDSFYNLLASTLLRSRPPSRNSEGTIASLGRWTLSPTYPSGELELVPQSLNVRWALAFLSRIT